ncbi:MAG: hypothetical protein KME20_06650 [Kaiparowitsia implicata GSE-PSE-MK54-09C]|jgi:hypothetical protein|nr:hypothetical protein [Kaiparowitsia implicata GSE-PSE-MK54-09C]
MSQASLLAWLPLVFGGGGIIGLSALVIKSLTDSKDETIRRLERSKEDLEKAHAKHVLILKEKHDQEVGYLHRDLESKKSELKRMGDFRQLLEEAVEDLAQKGITSETSYSLRKIESFLVTIEQNKEYLQSSQTAADWVHYKKDDWLQLALRTASEAHPDLITDDKVESFKQDIYEYLRWLAESLQHGFFCRIEDYVENHTIDLVFPYRTAIHKIIATKDFGQLSTSEAQYLKDYLGELVKLIG